MCKKYTRAALHTLCKQEGVGAQLLTVHNIAYMMRCVLWPAVPACSRVVMLDMLTPCCVLP